MCNQGVLIYLGKNGSETIASHHNQICEELETAMRVWFKYYNESRIKEKLGGQSPIEYRISTTEQVA
jgi:transposase InsO family protein